VDYKLLNAKQKETFNFQKLSAELADFGFTCIKLADDWEGADFLAVEMRGDAILRVQLKGRFAIAKKYAGKELWMAFPHAGVWYLIEHDRLVEVVGANTPWLETASWKEAGSYSSKSPSKALLEALSGFRLKAEVRQANPAVDHTP
jgi:frataxin-like iron-binding protein CyaY